MWGYIHSATHARARAQVPSLYVRVYRYRRPTGRRKRSSLIICEGISRIIGRKGQIAAFPHYMWGYIDSSAFLQSFSQVPSLYVRVYRQRKRQERREPSSLIICEGISAQWGNCLKKRLFPHYMWGYIGSTINGFAALDVPSLYVRVYRERGWKRKVVERSLIICEGISRLWRQK